MSGVAERVAGRFAAARTDAALLQAGLHVEQVTALAYDVAARGDRTRPWLRRHAEHERAHAAALETMLQALTVPVRERAGDADLDALLPDMRGVRGVEALRRLAELEAAAIAGHQQLGRRLQALDGLRTVATVMAGGAQHLVVLRDALGSAPLTQAYETGS